MKKTPKQQQADMSSDLNSVESSPATTPVHQMKSDHLPAVIGNSFNSMDLQSPTNRNLSEKELRDCDVIGMYIYFLFVVIIINDPILGLLYICITGILKL